LPWFSCQVWLSGAKEKQEGVRMSSRDDFMQHFLRHEADLKAFIGSLVLDAHLRADVFQEVALTLWQQIDHYDPARSFGAWARGIAANKVLQMRQRSARFPIAFAPETIRAVLDAFERTEEDAADRADALRECIRLLPEKSRHLLALRYEENLPGEEIARRVSGSLEAIYQSLSRIRARLQECIRRRLALQERTL
jgi:RNA polymerase sigma-70 factor (ECF subfamily)